MKILTSVQSSVLLLAIYMLLSCKHSSPQEEHYLGEITSAPPSTIPFSNYLSINAFEWNFAQEKSHEKIDEERFKLISTFSGVRHYLEWDRIESSPGRYTFSVSHSGGWDYDEIYRRMSTQQKFLVIDIKGCPQWLLQSYPEGQRDAENVPAPFGVDRKLPASYIAQARAAFQLAARYGSNTNIDKSLLSVDTTIRWTDDPRNTIKVGLGYIKFIECDNERDKWWKGPQAQQTPEEYAANLSAFYDGHKGSLGKGVGIKSADPNIQVVMGGIAEADPAFVERMIAWCRTNRGSKPDGSVNLCFDVINYHLYANDAFNNNGKSSTGIAPELSNLRSTASNFLKMSATSASSIPVWVSETGYDIVQGSTQRAIPIGNKSSLITQADWNIRTALLYSRTGIDRCVFYMLDNADANSSTQYSSSGFINPDFSRRPSADYFLQANALMGDYRYQGTINADPIVDVYVKGQKRLYVLTVPDQTGRTENYQLDLAGSANALVHRFDIGKSLMSVQRIASPGGKLNVSVSETPIFIEAEN